MSEQGTMTISVMLDPKTAAYLAQLGEETGKGAGELVIAAIGAYQPGKRSRKREDAAEEPAPAAE